MKMSKDNKKAKATNDTKKKVNKSTKVRRKSETTKCERCNKPFSYDPSTCVNGVKPALCRECYEADNKKVFNGVCKDCGKPFYVKAKDANFLKSKGLELPKRCFECRNIRKIERAKAEEAK